MWKKQYERAMQFLFPLHCPVCDKIVKPFGERVCLTCLGKMKLLTPPWCVLCGKKIVGEQEYCTDCKETKHVYTRGRALYEYQSAAQSIYRFKYGGRKEYASFYAEEMVHFLGDFIQFVRPDGIVPVPLHKKRRRERGYNQAGILSNEVGKRLGIPVYDKYLCRVRATAPLKNLNPKERQNNLKKAFIVSENDVKLERVIVIDDIYTTGSTIDAIATVLKQCGVKEIYFITLACGAGI